MRILGWIVFVGFSLGLTLSAYAGEDTQWYAPIVIQYMNGDFIALGQAGIPIQGKHECLEKLQRDVGNALTSGVIPHGGSILGGCVPIPKAPEPMIGS